MSSSTRTIEFSDDPWFPGMEAWAFDDIAKPFREQGPSSVSALSVGDLEVMPPICGRNVA